MLIEDLLAFRPEALERLAILRETDPTSAIAVAWQFVQRSGSDGRHIPSEFSLAIGLLLKRTLGDAAFETAIMASWQEFESNGREMVSYAWACMPNLLSDRFLLTLFTSEQTTTDDRIVLLNSLFLTWNSRSISKQVLLDLIRLAEDSSPAPTPPEQRYLTQLREDISSHL
jgi:hypothetical protein